LGSCASARPNEVGVDHEALLIDLDACMDDPSCHSPKAFRFDYVVPGQHAVYLPVGESITARIINRPSGSAKLVYVVLAMASQANGDALDVTVDGFPLQEVSPFAGPNRTELQLQTPGNATLVPGDTIKIANNPEHSKDPFAVIWVVGRWAD
jgi:hypothetical protein